MADDAVKRRSSCSTWMTALNILISMATSACMPLINHPPYVENGGRTTITSTFSHVGARRERPRVVGPALSGRYTQGWHPSSNVNGLGLQAAVDVSLFNGVIIDGYAQLPRTATGAFDVGFGGAALGGMYKGPMAYAQAGRRLTRYLYLYTTQNVVRLQSLKQSYPFRTTWQPTVATEWTLDDVHYGVFVSGAVGDVRTEPVGQWTANAPLARITIGFSRHFYPPFAGFPLRR